MSEHPIAILAMTMLLAACTNEQPAPTYIDPAKIPLLQKTATNACLCLRNQGSAAEASCWKEFNDTVALYLHDGGADSACAAGSSSVLTFSRKIDAAAATNPAAIKPIRSMSVTTAFPYGACSWAEVPAKKAEYERKSGKSGC